MREGGQLTERLQGVAKAAWDSYSYGEPQSSC